MQAVEALAMSVIIGLIYFNLSLDQVGLRDRFGLCYIVGALYPYMVILDVIGQCKQISMYESEPAKVELRLPRE